MRVPREKELTYVIQISFGFAQLQEKFDCKCMNQFMATYVITSVLIVLARTTNCLDKNWGRV